MKKASIILVIIVTLLPLFAEAQSFYAIRRDRSLILTAGVGNAAYFGDLKDGNKIFDPKLNVTAGLQYYINPRISVRTDFTFFQLAADDADSEDPSRQRRNLSFKSNNFELTATGAINLFPHQGTRFYQRPPFNFYGFAGIGFLYTNPKAELDGEWHALQPLETEGVSYSRLQFVVPYGLGVRVKAGPFLNVAVEGGSRLTFTDYLDDVSTVYPDPASFTDPIAAALSMRYENPVEPETQRGDPSNKDSYFMLNLKIEYYLPHNFLFDDRQRKLYNSKRKSYYRRRR